MTRRAVALDRVVTLLSGIGLLALGCFLVAWQQRIVSPRIELANYVQAWWWPWACAATGLVSVALGCRWLAAHRYPRKASRVSLAARTYDFTADADCVATAAAAALGQETGVVKARGSAVIERGQPTVTLTAVVPARRGIQPGIAAADRTAQTVGRMLGEEVAVRTVLRIDFKRGVVVQ